MLNPVSKKGENSTCWSAFDQHVDICWELPKSWSTINQHVARSLKINMLTNYWTTLFQVATFWTTIDQHCEETPTCRSTVVKLCNREKLEICTEINAVTAQLNNRWSTFVVQIKLLWRSWSIVAQQVAWKINMLINFWMLSHGWIQHVDQLSVTLPACRPFNMLINSWSTLKWKSLCGPRLGAPRLRSISCMAYQVSSLSLILSTKYPVDHPQYSTQCL